MKKKLIMVGILLLSLLIVFALAGFIYETISYKNVKSNYPPDGQMIEVGNRDIHMNMEGDSTENPPVVIETGTGNWSYDWSNIQKELSEHTQVITYDRAGYGWSDPSDGEFSLDSTVADLNAVIEEINTDTPVVIIAHSVGGIYARHFIDEHKDKVAGVILVDSRNEFFKDESTAEYNEAFFGSQSQSMNKMLARLGVTRLFGANTLEGMPKYISKEKYAHVQYDAPFFKTLDEEVKHIPDNVEKLKELQSLKDIPLTIITPEEADTQAAELGFSNEQEKEINQKWLHAQEKLTELSTNSEFVTVPDSSHAVMYDQPDVIEEEVLQMIEDME